MRKFSLMRKVVFLLSNFPVKTAPSLLEGAQVGKECHKLDMECLTALNIWFKWHSNGKKYFFLLIMVL